VGTLYDVLLKQPQCVIHARAAPSIAFAEAAAAAATSAAKTAKDAAAFALAAAAHPPVRVISSNNTGLAREDNAVHGAAEAASHRATDVTAFVADVATANNDAAAGAASDRARDDGDGADASPFAVPIDSVVANVVLQSQHAPPNTAIPMLPTVEYASRSGVRCLRCMHVFYDKSGFNRHCSTYADCRPPSFQLIHKITQASAAAAASAASFNASEAPQYSPQNPI
jgi:hypothetical protein